MSGMDGRRRLLLHQPVPMRDGVQLSADVWLPPAGAAADERYPALLIRNIYNNADRRYLSWMEPFVDAGYAVVMQDCRGRHDSDGTWDPYICELNDGFDTHEWVGSQSWCDGQVATFGVSYPGFTQTLPATLRSSSLKALVPIASQQDNWGHHRVSGALHWSVSLFFSNLIGRTMQTEPVALVDQAAMLRHLPLASAIEAWTGRRSEYYRGIVEHDRYDEWWSRYSLRDRYGEVDVPAYFMTGWYDSLLWETLTVFQGWKAHARSEEARRLTRILVGPWSHQIAPWGRAPLGPDGEFEEQVFGADAVGDNIGEHLRWYDARLRGAANGIDDEPPVRLFVMGRNAWRDEWEWPIARTQWTDLYLQPGGGLATTRPPDGASPDHFTYDPEDPVPSWGAQYQSADLGGPRDRRAVEERADVLTFTSSPLEADIEVTGPIEVELWAATDAPDTDWTAALVDVVPDGRAIILCEGICRQRYAHDLLGEPRLIPPNTPTAFRINLWATSNAFLAGHRIRLEISSSNFPRFDRNPNTGHPTGLDTELRVARQTVFHDAARASRLILPVIPPRWSCRPRLPRPRTLVGSDATHHPSSRGEPLPSMRSASRAVAYLLGLALVLPGGVLGSGPGLQTQSEHWLTVDRSVVTWSEAVTFSASIVTIAIVPPPNVTIELQRSSDGQTWGRISPDLTSDGQGSYTAVHRPRLSARYRAVLRDANGAATATSAVVGVLVRQLAIQRPVHQAAKTIARGTSVTFTTTLRPIGPDLPRAQVLYLVYQRTSGIWRQVAFRQATADAEGVARLTWRFATRGEYYVRSKGMGNWRESIDDHGTNFDSVLTPIARFSVR